MNYYIVDVFSDRPFMGNPVAVVICERGMEVCEMQQIASWFNLSETTFVFDIEASKRRYKTRIFSPTGELPFAGHPTLGTASAVRKHISYSESQIIQECPGGLIDIRFDTENESIHLKSPTPVFRDMDRSQIDHLSHVLDLSGKIMNAAVIEIGPIWITAMIDSSEAIERLRINLDSIKAYSDEIDATGIVLGAVMPDMTTVKVRAFAPSVGVPEDPVCGSGNIALALLRAQGEAGQKDYIAKQGQEIGRDGEVQISYLDKSEIELGGKTYISAKGKLIIH